MLFKFTRFLRPSTVLHCSAFALAIGLSSATAFAGDTDDVAASTNEERFDLIVREDIFGGFNGDDEAMKRGLAKCDEILQKNPKHVEAMVWRGAGRVFLAGQAFSKNNPVEGMKLWTSGLKDMDQAVELEPENLAVRIPRAAVLMPASAGAPEFMAKPLLAKAKADFEKIYKEQKETIDQLGEHPEGELRMGLADVYRRLGETDKSREQLEAITKSLPDTDYSRRAEKWLAADSSVKLTHNCIGCHDK